MRYVPGDAVIRKRRAPALGNVPAVRKPRCFEYQRAVLATSGTKKVGTAALIWMSAWMAVEVSIKEVVSHITVVVGQVYYYPNLLSHPVPTNN
jgi:hypothetical protein